MTTLRIFRKEVHAFFSTPMLYIFLTVFLSLSGGIMFYVNDFFASKFARLNALFMLLPYLLLVFVPAVAMRLWAEENKSGTTEILMTLPIRDWEAVLGKYLAALFVIVLALALTFPIPVVVSKYAAPDTPMDYGPVWGGYVGMFLIAAVFLALSTVMSALTKNQIVAFILGITACLGLFIIGTPTVLTLLPSGLVPFFSYVGIGAHLTGIVSGVFDSRALVYLISVVLFLLFATVRIVDSRRWR